MKAALTRIKDAALARCQQLVEEAMALQERLDGLNHALTERTEENATLTTQVRDCHWEWDSQKPLAPCVCPAC